MDLIVLADSDGVIDMTPEFIARTTNVPLDQINEAIAAFCEPDPRSNTPNEQGRRLLPIDKRKPWGWQIVNYHHYRSIRDEESRRLYYRDYRRKEREAKRVKKSNPGPKDPQSAAGRHLKRDNKSKLPMVTEVPTGHREEEDHSF